MVTATSKLRTYAQGSSLVYHVPVTLPASLAHSLSASATASSASRVASSLCLSTPPSSRSKPPIDSCGTPADPPVYVDVSSIEVVPEQTLVYRQLTGPRRRNDVAWYGTEGETVGPRGVVGKFNQTGTNGASSREASVHWIILLTGGRLKRSHRYPLRLRVHLHGILWTAVLSVTCAMSSTG